MANQAHCGRGIFKMLSAVERFKPDPSIAAQELRRHGPNAAPDIARNRKLISGGALVTSWFRAPVGSDIRILDLFVGPVFDGWGPIWGRSVRRRLGRSRKGEAQG